MRSLSAAALTLTALLLSHSLSAEQGISFQSLADSTGQRTEQQAHDLEARRERQLGAGLTTEAAQTERELAELTRTQVEKCRSWWAQNDALQQGQIPKNLIRDVKTAMRLADECSWRPGASSSTNPSSRARRNRPEPDNDLDNQLNAERQGATRAPMFIEPSFLYWSVDREVFDAVLSGKDAATLSPEFEGMFAAASRAFGSDPAVADRLLAQVSDGLKQSPDTKPAALARVLEQRSALAEAIGRPSDALQHVQAQLAILERAFGSSSPNLCPALWHLAALQVSLDQSGVAIESASRCLAIATPRAPTSLTYASALNNLAVVHQRTGDIDRAIDGYDKSLAVLTQQPAGPIAMVFQPALFLHANLGLAYWQRGNVVDSYRQLQLARELMQKEGASIGTETGAVQALARLSQELDFFLTVERAAPDSLARGNTLALPMLLERKAFGLDTKTTTMRALANDAGMLREYRALLASRAALARTPATDVTDQSVERQRRAQAAELDRQILVLESEANGRVSQRAALTTFVSRGSDRRATEFAKAKEAAFTRRLKEYDKRRPKKERNQISDEMLNELYRQAEDEVSPKFGDVFTAEMQRSRGSREALLPAIQGKLTDAAALVEVIRFHPFNAAGTARYGAFIVRRTGAPAFLDFGDAAAIEDLVVEFRRTLSAPRGTLAHDLGRRLDALLMQPVRAQIGGATQIYLSPDGMLNLVPFGALVDERDRYLVESYAFDYVSSGRDLLREPAPATARPGAPVVIADPVFDGATGAGNVSGAPQRSAVGTHFDLLPGTAAEAEALRTILPNANVLTRERATESAIKNVVAPQILHVATHGFFLEDQDFSASASVSLEDPMLRSGLVFAGANAGRSGEDDGVLTALEAEALSLSGTQLVVLSACETGVGDVKTGEGVFGLRRAFLAAGAETLVMSLWRVDDDATRMLMVDFYRRIATGEARVEALRQAALSQLRDPAHRHPFYWASFIASGEAGAIRGSRF